MGRRRVRALLRLPDTTKLDRLSIYASTIAFQWLFAVLILWRTSRHAIRPAQLGLRLVTDPLVITISVVLAILLLALQILSARSLGSDSRALASETVQLARKVFPRDVIERFAFFALVATAAICEEFIYRGFAQFVFQDWSHSVLVGLFASSLLFSVAHLYQGGKGLVSTFAIGMLFAGVRAWTGTLLPTIIGHFVADFAVGVLAPLRIRDALARAANQGIRPEKGT
jgi:membrane protease YdiL (CAAX protease family)